MQNITSFLSEFQTALTKTFGERVWFFGLQGSYARAEATVDSDIDIVVILDNLAASDLRAYNSMLDTLPHRELICGFISGKQELFNWEPSDLLQFYYDTKPIIGTLDELLPLLDDSAVNRAIKIGACNIYHACVHNVLHEKSEEILKSLYKSATFVVQAICLKQTKKHLGSKNDLLQCIGPDEQAIINTYLDFKNGNPPDFKTASDTLFAWSQKWITA